jgi:hypothetical protein
LAADVMPDSFRKLGILKQKDKEPVIKVKQGVLLK